MARTAAEDSGPDRDGGEDSGGAVGTAAERNLGPTAMARFPVARWVTAALNECLPMKSLDHRSPTGWCCGGILMSLMFLPWD